MASESRCTRITRWIPRGGWKAYGVRKLILPAKTPASTSATRYWGGDNEKQKIQEKLSVQLGPITSCFLLLNASMDEAPFCRDKLHDAIQRLSFLPEILKTALHLLLMIQAQTDQDTPNVATSVHSVRSILEKTTRQPDADTDTDEPPRLSVLDCIIAKIFWKRRQLLNTSPFQKKISDRATAADRTVTKTFPYLALLRLQWLEDFRIDGRLPWGAAGVFKHPGSGKRYRIYYGFPEIDYAPPDRDLSLNQRRLDADRLET
ncbi:hypothetical protein PG985_013076 [Apiospora marii]|uniref:Uncharacterized protein n=1 Tax=Apiospora marii TaxID=335849 RepID=A0ABR1RBQ5_9PEZI